MTVDVCEKIRLLRVSHNLTQEEMAEKLNLSPSGYAKIERCETDISVSRLEQIAQTFNLSIIDLLSLSHTPAKSNMVNFNDRSKNKNIYLGSPAMDSPAHQYLVHELEKLKLIVEAQSKEIELLKILLDLRSGLKLKD